MYLPNTKDRVPFAMPSRKTKEATKLQSQRFIDAAREAGASEDEAVFDENLKRIAKVKPKTEEAKSDG
jgi:hypothetical protein